MSSISRAKLTSEEVKSKIAAMMGWSVENEMLTKIFEFKTYTYGVIFVSGVAVFAEQLDHHPDILLTYRKVKISLSTHDANGLTDYDFVLAQKIETLV